MRARFKTTELEELYFKEKGANKYPNEVVEQFFTVMSIIDAAKDERDLYALRSRHFEKLRGNRQNQLSLRLTKSWRLILTLETDDQGKCVVIIEITNHYE